MMARTTSITMQNLMEIARRTSAWEDEMWCFFLPQGRRVEPIQVKFGREKRTVGPLLLAKFDLDQSRGGVYGPQNWKKLEFYQYNCP